VPNKKPYNTGTSANASIAGTPDGLQQPDHQSLSVTNAQNEHIIDIESEQTSSVLTTTTTTTAARTTTTTTVATATAATATAATTTTAATSGTIILDGSMRKEYELFLKWLQDKQHANLTSFTQCSNELSLGNNIIKPFASVIYECS
jgi:hypothetical protein